MLFLININDFLYKLDNIVAYSDETFIPSSEKIWANATNDE